MTRSRRVLVAAACIALLLSASAASERAQGQQKKFTIEPIPAAYLADLPFTMPEIRLPEFPERSLNVATEFNAIGDGRTMNTEAFSRAIQACASQGGGMVVVPPGEYLTGPIRLESNVNLHLERGALIVFSKRFEDYPLMPFPTPKSKNFRCTPPIWAYKCDNIAITGDGVIDGSGEAWRPAKKEKYTEGEWKEMTRKGVLSADGKMWFPSQEAMNGEEYLKNLKKSKKNPTAEETAGAREYLRPKMVELYACTRVLLDGPTFRNSPMFAVHPAQCEHLVVRNVTIQNPYSAQNGDGLDLSACHTAIVYKTVVDAGDDAICIKPGGFEEKKDWQVSCENIIIADCTVYHGHGGFVIGSETYGGARNILARNLTLLGTDVGLRFKSARERGSLVEKIFVDGVVMKDIQDEAILFDTFYASGSAEKNALGRDASRAAEDVTERTPRFTDFSIRRVTCLGAGRPMILLGLPEMPIKNISIAQSVFTARKGGLLVDADGVTLDNVKIYPEAGPVFAVNEAKHIAITQGVMPGSASAFMKVEGAGSDGIVIAKTALSDAAQQVTLGAGVSPAAVAVQQ